MRKALVKRDIKMTWTLFLVCFCYFIFVGSVALLYIIDNHVKIPFLNLAIHCFYWFQYSLNFLVYAARSGQFRKAYLYFLKKVKIFREKKLVKMFCFEGQKPDLWRSGPELGVHVLIGDLEDESHLRDIQNQTGGADL